MVIDTRWPRIKAREQADREKGKGEVRTMKALKMIAAVLVIVGALNWGLVALAHFDLVATLLGMNFGQTSALSSMVYGLVGLSGLYQLVTLAGVIRSE
jgi:uncharacterized membrane protein YuzA (DUF378 family)